MALSDEILADLKAKKGGPPKGGPPAKGPPMPVAAEGPADQGAEYGSDEEAAMQDFESATTPAEKVSALKAFMAICYPQLESAKGGQ